MTTPTQLLQAKSLSAEIWQDLDQLLPGDLVDVVWAFQNNSDQPWRDVALVYTDETYPDTTEFPHTNLADDDSFALTDLGSAKMIVPGDTAYVTMSFTAPQEPGVYLTGWQLQTADGLRFGPVQELRLIVIEPPEKALVAHSYEMVGFQNSAANYNAMRGGQSFVGTWTLKNDGINAWNGDYKVVVSAEATPNTSDAVFSQMGAPSTAALKALSGVDSVPPDATVTLQIPFTAPDKPGIYSFHWQLTDDAGHPFGGMRWMRIVVTQADGTAPPRRVDSAEATYSGPAVTFFTGIHGPADDWMWGDVKFQQKMRALNMPVFFWSHGANGDHAGFGDPRKNAVRLYWNPRPVSAEEAYKEVRDDQLRNWWNRGYRRFIFFNEPQFGAEIAGFPEGFGIAWHSKEQFASFLAKILRLARQEFPGIQLFTTPMSSNAAFDPWGWRAAMWQQVRGLVSGWCMHAYTGNNADANAAAQDIANQVVELQRRFQLKIPIIISEASVNRGSDAEQKARVAHLLHQKLARVPGVEGVFWYAADWSPEMDKHKEGWFRNGIADAYMRQRSAV